MSKTHGASKSPTYKIWKGVLRRTTNPASKDFRTYGAMGITICDRWRKFENFLADMGERPTGLTLDRIDNNRGYEPGNCRRATPREQARNCRNSKLTLGTATEIVYRRLQGEMAPRLAAEFGVHTNMVYHIEKGRSWPDALAAAQQRLNDRVGSASASVAGGGE